jgi:hypothetical protein
MSILSSTILTGSSTLACKEREREIEGERERRKERVSTRVSFCLPIHPHICLSILHFPSHLDLLLGALDLLVRLVEAFDQHVELGVDVVLELGQAAYCVDGMEEGRCQSVEVGMMRATAPQRHNSFTPLLHGLT